ncbi:MAG: transposase [Patescibacteria group bacterium]|jgi:REP element-mobilizing transposase RayT
MFDLFLDKYRVLSTRLPNYNYTKSGRYFVTICAKKRFACFGYIKNNIMCVNNIGKIIYNEWYRTALLRPYVTLDQFIVMPDHVHGILIINKNHDHLICIGKHNNVETHCNETVETPWQGVSTGPRPHNPRHHIEWQPHSLGSMINQFKGMVTRECRKRKYYDFKWQSRFYDHVIRNEPELNNVRNYILNNPKHWNSDRDDSWIGKMFE